MTGIIFGIEYFEAINPLCRRGFFYYFLFYMYHLLQKCIVKTCKNIYFEYTHFMSKNKYSISDIFVKKIVKKKAGIYTKKQILDIWLISGGSERRFAYALGLLYAKKLAMRVSADIFLLHDTEPDLYYWDIINTIVKEYCSQGVIVGGEKALEIHMLNLAPAQKLVLYTSDFSARIRLYEGREVHFRVLNSGEKTNYKNLFPFLKKNAQKFVKANRVFVPNVEISLLEALSLREHELGVNSALVLQFLRQHHKKIDNSRLSSAVRHRYIRACNRLRSLARDHGYESVYAGTLDAIRTEGGGVFLSI